MPDVTIPYSNHWPEVVPLVAERVGPGDLLVAEDAPSPEFRQMLAGAMSIDDYLLATDIEFPEFGRRMCRLWRRLRDSGAAIVPVEPFVQTLLEIHEHLAGGGTPDAFEKGTRRHAVYMAEREATGALIDFYQASAEADFDQVLAATRRFARCDARRFVLRDRLRAEAIAALQPNHPRIRVEACQIHLALARFLRRLLPPEVEVRPVFLMRAAAARLGLNGHLYPPGDLLTLNYVFHPDRKDPHDDLLAARALIYAKVAAKDEIGPDPGPFGRTLDDLRTIRMVNRISMRACRALYPQISRASGAESRRILASCFTEARI